MPIPADQVFSQATYKNETTLQNMKFITRTWNIPSFPKPFLKFISDCDVLLGSKTAPITSSGRNCGSLPFCNTLKPTSEEKKRETNNCLSFVENWLIIINCLVSSCKLKEFVKIRRTAWLGMLLLPRKHRWPTS